MSLLRTLLTSSIRFRTPLPLPRPNQPLYARARARALTSTTTSLFPRKDSQDKDSMSTEATEYSKSGNDDMAAKEEEAAFDPELTSPESQHKKAEEGNGVSLVSRLNIHL